MSPFTTALASLALAGLTACAGRTTAETAAQRAPTRGAAAPASQLITTQPSATQPSATQPSATQPGTTRQLPAQRTTHTPLEAGVAARARAACDGGDLVACHAAGLDAYDRPSAPQTDRDAVRYFTRACDGGYAPSCNGLGVLHAQGRGVPQDLTEAARLYRRACERGASTGCQHLAIALREGRGVDVDVHAAERAEARQRCVFEASLGRAALESCPSI